MFSKRFVISHKVSFAILVFLFFFGALHLWKPDIIYAKDGAFRPFGVGYQNKTILPIWLISILLAIFSYIAVSWYITLSYDL